MQHPLESGQIFQSVGGHFTYRVIGPCCRLFDREELPWPCCRLQWRSKEPSWRRVGRRFVPDIGAKNCPSYSVEILGKEASQEPIILTCYWVRLPKPLKEWWYSIKPQSDAIAPPLSPDPPGIRPGSR
ncbi:MAG: hypothetical protein IGR80_08100 [Synechococcales cyanobacterium K44_A2020_017]|nr:hypothetical protein [Synechococcales cyanobacterium K32_A2020_035]MBF2094710.1 hypothetical protein [Synechococcales cyanobacterium K44_A2020_017]